MCISVFNKLPQSLRELPFKYFKIRLRKWLVDQVGFYTIDDMQHKINVSDYL